MAMLAGGCGDRMLGAHDSGAAGTGGGAAGTGGGAAGKNGDVPDAGPDTPDASPPTVDPWIYVATETGVERINTAGGGFVPFGMAAATRSVFPSPNGQLIAQELADNRVAVFAADGTPRATFDVRQGLRGWSDDSTLLFLDVPAGFLRQTNADGTTRRYVPMPPGLNASGHLGATLSPDRTLLLTASVPPGAGTPSQYDELVLSAVDGTLVLNLGPLSRGGLAWTGDGRVVIADSSGPGFVAVTPRSGARTPVPAAAALDSACGYTSWYETGKILAGKTFVPPGSDVATCVPSVVVDVDTGSTSPPGPVIPGNTFALGVAAFAQSADGRQAAVADGAVLELGAVAGGARPQLGTASRAIVGVGWAHPTGGTANLVAPPPPPQTATGLAGAPTVGSRSGGTDCRTGRWVNRTPDPLPAGWPPAPLSNFSFAFDADRGTLLVEGSFRSPFLGPPNLDYETMEWDGARGQWTNRSRADGFGPADGRPMAYDAHRKVVLALGPSLFGDGPWSWTVDLGWSDLRAQGPTSVGPSPTNNAASVYDIGRDRWIVSGGYAETATWEWDGIVWTRSTAPPPGGTTQLAGAQLAYDAKRSVVYSVGNRDRGTSPWLYDVAQNRWIAQPSSGPSPLPRDFAGVAYDARRDRVMVFGGFALIGGGGGNTFGDLAEWDPASGAWQTCPTTGAAPPARTHAALTYDRTRDVLLLFGGDTVDSTAATDVWEWYVP
jgi:hypothetical protein